MLSLVSDFSFSILRGESGRGNNHTLSSGTDHESGTNSFTLRALHCVLLPGIVRGSGLNHTLLTSLALAHLLPQARRRRQFMMRFSSFSVVVEDNCFERPVGDNFPFLPLSHHHWPLLSWFRGRLKWGWSRGVGRWRRRVGRWRRRVGRWRRWVGGWGSWVGRRGRGVGTFARCVSIVLPWNGDPSLTVYMLWGLALHATNLCWMSSLACVANKVSTTDTAFTNTLLLSSSRQSRPYSVLHPLHIHGFFLRVLTDRINSRILTIWSLLRSS